MTEKKTEKKKTVKMDVPEAFEPLFHGKQRYKFYHGGRGGGKSYAFADALLISNISDF